MDNYRESKTPQPVLKSYFTDHKGEGTDICTTGFLNDKNLQQTSMSNKELPPSDQIIETSGTLKSCRVMKYHYYVLMEKPEKQAAT